MKYKWFTFFNQLRKLYDDMLDPLVLNKDINRRELDILLFLYNNPQYNRATDVVEKRKIAKAYVSTSLKNLENLGYIDKTTTIDNKKEFILKITQKALPLIKKGVEVQEKFHEILYEGLNANEIKDLESRMERLFKNIEKATGANI